MKLLNGGNIKRVALGEIIVGADRQRGVGEAQVENLLLMAEDTGITTPILIRRLRGEYHLIDGGHRLEAARRLEMPDIAALVYECSDAEARRMEASNNLGAARMTPVQTVMFFSSWKREYYKAHPDRQPGVFKGNQYTGNLVTGNLPVTKMMADAFGCDESTIYRALRVGESLNRVDAERLDRAPHRITMEDLKAISRITEDADREKVIAALETGKVKRAAKAISALKPATDQAPKDPVEEAFKVLMKEWARAPMAARRRFVSEIAGDLDDMAGGAPDV